MTDPAEFCITTLKSQFRGISNLITLDRRASRPLYQQIYESFRGRIIRGELRAGDLVPSSRELARESHISRLPALTAYAQLLAEDISRAESAPVRSSPVRFRADQQGLRRARLRGGACSRRRLL